VFYILQSERKSQSNSVRYMVSQIPKTSPAQLNSAEPFCHKRMYVKKGKISPQFIKHRAMRAHGGVEI